MVQTSGTDLTDTESSSGEEAIKPKQRLINRSQYVKEPVASGSPAPIPTKGGADEFVKVSRVTSIQVKLPVVDEAPAPKIFTKKKSASKPAAGEASGQKASSPGRSNRVVESESEDEELEDEVMDMDDDEDDESSDDEDIVPENDPMDLIEVSPYEGNSNAEREVKLFDDLKELQSHGTLNPKASRIFGPSNARIMVRAYDQINHSGMIYSQEWVDGIIRGTAVGKIPKDLLLLCLVSKRLVKVDEFLLAGLTRDLEVFKTVKEAVQAWNLDSDYKRIAGTPDTVKNFTFNGKRRHCFKCEIFVARTYSCSKAFGPKGGLEKSLMKKIRKCLDIMESRLPDPVEKAKKKRKKSLEKAAAEKTIMGRVESIPTEIDAPPPKRKRGRPPKNKKLAPPKSEPKKSEPKDDIYADLDSPVQVIKNRGSSTRPGRKKGGGKHELSLEDMVGRFEEQYEVVGKKYKEMGETLAQLKYKLKEYRSEREHAIRNELLMEVQKKFMRH